MLRPSVETRWAANDPLCGIGEIPESEAGQMENSEGVIKFSLSFTQESCLGEESVARVNGWRHILYRLQLIGQSPGRYLGYGFGNISIRAAAPPGAFIISGTQTGGKPFLHASDYALVTSCDPLTNRVSALGETRPSSESLTHGQLYQLDSGIGSVVHVHCPEIWRQAETLGLPVTSKNAAYGTPEMALEVEKLFRAAEVHEKRIFVLAGHEDGVVSFGRDVGEACAILLESFAAACSLPKAPWCWKVSG